ncbi:MAG: heme ABC transporter ATP-binding protein [Bacteroidetes bacterium]|nr:heme ABC transporter ATP-binding protein [Bacteroidota bacterium]
MLTLDHISFQAGDKKLLQDVSAQWHVGHMNLIIGPNGAGKSTLIKCISRQLPIHSGEIYFNKKEITQSSFESLARERAVLSQQIEVAFPLKVWEVVMMGRYPHFKNFATQIDQQICEEVMRYFDVWSFGERDYLTLSGGEKQRVQFARVLAQLWTTQPLSPRLLLLDEPLTFLDIRYQIQFMKQLKQLIVQQNLVVVGVVHDLNLAARFADTLTLLHEGCVLATGLTTEVLTRQNISTAFQIEADVVSQPDGVIHLLFR